MLEFEVGVVKCGVLGMAWRSVLTVFRTYRTYKRRGLEPTEWYGVYIKGTEMKVAEFGCSPTAQSLAYSLLRTLQQDSHPEGRPEALAAKRSISYADVVERRHQYERWLAEYKKAE